MVWTSLQSSFGIDAEVQDILTHESTYPEHGTKSFMRLYQIVNDNYKTHINIKTKTKTKLSGYG